MTNGFLWIKTLHLMFVISWFAGLFYLPRIFVNLAMVPADSTAERDRLLLMARKLYRFMMPLMVLSLVFGLWLWIGYGVGKGSGWMHAKLAIVIILIGFQHGCGRLIKKLAAGSDRHSHVWFRWFNEVPTIALLLTLVLVVIKPF
jgi:putative membrane protein